MEELTCISCKYFNYIEDYCDLNDFACLHTANACCCYEECDDCD